MKRSIWSTLVSFALLVFVIAGILAVAAQPASADAMRVKLYGGPTISEGTTVRADVLGNSRYRHVRQLCFYVNYSSANPLDVGETVTFSFRDGRSYGSVNVGSGTNTTTCLLSPYHDSTLALFLDGKDRFTISIAGGSVELLAIRAWIDAVT